MARDGSHNTAPNNLTYTPPRLPALLEDAHRLEPIVGVPSDEAVKAIHAAIRAVNGILTAPTLYDPDLPMQLAQHLFEVQMVVYHSKYGFNILPVDATYTPPPLPSHIHVTLEPVIGAPSDEEIKSVQNAVRAVDILANSPAIFDPDLSMNLPQHLFNIQAARYIQDSAQGRFASKPPESHSISEGTRSNAASGVDVEPRPIEIAMVDAPVYENEGQVIGADPAPPGLEPNYYVPSIGKVKEAQEEMNHLLKEVGEALKDINRVLVSTQHTMVRVQEGNPYFMVNGAGELPYIRGLPPLGSVGYGLSLSDISDENLARYLKFYNIGTECIEDGEEPKLGPDQRSKAERELEANILKTF